MTEIPRENARVVKWERTSTVYPCEWQGELADGRHIYIRYRTGTFLYGIGGTPVLALDATFRKDADSQPVGEARAFLKDSEMIAEMRKFGVSFENAENIGTPCEEW